MQSKQLWWTLWLLPEAHLKPRLHTVLAEPWCFHLCFKPPAWFFITITVNELLLMAQLSLLTQQWTPKSLPTRIWIFHHIIGTLTQSRGAGAPPLCLMRSQKHQRVQSSGIMRNFSQPESSIITLIQIRALSRLDCHSNKQIQAYITAEEQYYCYYAEDHFPAVL